ncbi:MAG: hypothetical protein ACOC4M_12200 [Promethearchaeia archaeon]
MKNSLASASLILRLISVGLIFVYGHRLLFVPARGDLFVYARAFAYPF